MESMVHARESVGGAMRVWVVLGSMGGIGSL
jgi:hypothetical protein